MNDLKSYSEWLNTTFVETYFAKTYFGSENISAQVIGKIKPYTNDLVNLRIGPARLRQLRIQPGYIKFKHL